MTSNTNVLVVDDEMQLRRTLADILADHGYVVDAAADGEAAVALCLARPYGAVLLDICMPILGGLETLKRIRAQTAAGRVILMSAHASDEEVQLGLAAGADAFLVKPLDLDEMLGMLPGPAESPS